MKRVTSFSFIPFLLAAVLVVQESRAQDYVRLGLPEGAIARLGKGFISGDVAYSPDGMRLAVSSSIGIWLYDAGTGVEIALLTGHTDDVTTVVFSPDGKTLASGSWDRTVRLWDVHTGNAITTLVGHTDDVNSVVFSPDGKTLASGSEDNTVRLWDVDTGNAITTLEGHTSGRFQKLVSS